MGTARLDPDRAQDAMREGNQLIRERGMSYVHYTLAPGELAGGPSWDDLETAVRVRDLLLVRRIVNQMLAAKPGSDSPG